jgi:thymidylate synthase ThyX
MSQVTPYSDFHARVVLDSISPQRVRLTTLEVTLPRFILAEVNTHRVFSRNSASSRAVPTAKFIDRVTSTPVIPIEWGLNRPGMSATEVASDEDARECTAIWLEARDDMVRHAQALLAKNVHKQIVNRLLEPFLWHTVVITSTEWSNFFHQRADANAQPEIRRAAELMAQALAASTPRERAETEWHLPFVAANDRALTLVDQLKLSVARCARTSYLQHDGIRSHQSDFDLYERLVAGDHWSPFEHQARPIAASDWSGNFRGWHQYRKDFVNENALESLSA